MNEKLEIARMATDLTIALLQNHPLTADDRVKYKALAGTAQNSPDALVVFDAICNHLLAKLTPH